MSLLILLSGSASAQPWWNPDYGQRARLTFDNAGQGTDLVDFPILAILQDQVNVDHGLAQLDGADLRFVDADGLTELPYEIASWDAAGRSLVWVGVPRIDAGSTTDHIWMYYANPQAPPAQDPDGVWADHAAVYHLDGDVLDASVPHHHGVDLGTAPTVGQIGGAQGFDGSGWVEVGDESSFDFTTSLTLSAWLRVDAFAWTGWDGIVTKGDQSWRLHRCGGSDQIALSLSLSDGVMDLCGGAGSEVNDGLWHHVVALYEAGGRGAELYIDGVRVAQAARSSTIGQTNDPVWLGNNFDFADRILASDLDEVRISGAVRSPDWITAEGLTAQDRFVTWCSVFGGDADADGVCDDDDACPGADDLLDSDGDTVADCLDPCPFDTVDDSDGDGVCDIDDVCPGSDDGDDPDGDGAPSGCDPCPDDDPDDSDGDGVCDSADRCPGFNDNADLDGDGTPNACDDCNATTDADADGVVDDCDLCPGHDDTIDADADGDPDGCDPCPDQAGQMDADGDGVHDCDDCDDADPMVQTDCGDSGGTGDTGRSADAPPPSTDGTAGRRTPGAPASGEGCGCATPAPPPLWLALALAGLWRRRSDPGATPRRTGRTAPCSARPPLDRGRR